MTPAEHAALPDRVHLAKTLLAHTHGGRGYDVYVPRAVLYRYVTAAEDVIEMQAAMLRADLTELTSHRRGRAEDAETNDALRREFYALKRDNTELRAVALAALSAAGVCGSDAAETIRRALEKTR